MLDSTAGLPLRYAGTMLKQTYSNRKRLLLDVLIEKLVSYREKSKQRDVFRLAFIFLVPC